MISERKIRKAVKEFCKNPSWKEHYDKAPTPRIKRYYALEFTWSYWEMRYSEKRADRKLKDYYDEADRLEEQFTDEEWEYVIKHCGGATVKAQMYEHMKKVKEKKEELSQGQQSTK